MSENWNGVDQLIDGVFAEIAIHEYEEFRASQLQALGAKALEAIARVKQLAASDPAWMENALDLYHVGLKTQIKYCELGATEMKAHSVWLEKFWNHLSSVEDDLTIFQLEKQFTPDSEDQTGDL